MPLVSIHFISRDYFFLKRDNRVINLVGIVRTMNISKVPRNSTTCSIKIKRSPANTDQRFYASTSIGYL